MQMYCPGLEAKASCAPLEGHSNPVGRQAAVVHQACAHQISASPRKMSSISSAELSQLSNPIATGSLPLNRLTTCSHIAAHSIQRFPPDVICKIMTLQMSTSMEMQPHCSLVNNPLHGRLLAFQAYLLWACYKHDLLFLKCSAVSRRRLRFGCWTGPSSLTRPTTHARLLASISSASQNVTST